MSVRIGDKVLSVSNSGHIWHATRAGNGSRGHGSVGQMGHVGRWVSANWPMTPHYFISPASHSKIQTKVCSKYSRKLWTVIFRRIRRNWYSELFKSQFFLCSHVAYHVTHCSLSRLRFTVLCISVHVVKLMGQLIVGHGSFCMGQWVMGHYLWPIVCSACYSCVPVRYVLRFTGNAVSSTPELNSWPTF